MTDRRSTYVNSVAIAVLLLLAGLFLWQALSLPMTEIDGLFPWQQQRWQRMLLVSGAWFLLLTLISLARLLRPSHPVKWGPPTLPRRAPLIVLSTVAILFLAAYGWLAVIRHQRFNSTGYDLAINEQIVWNTLNGRFFASSVEVDNSFADHFRPFLLFIAPFYAIFPSPVTLLILQTIGLALGAIPLYLLAEEKLGDRLVALVIAAVYLLYPAIGFVARFDFHIEVFAIPAFLAAFYSLQRERWGWATFWLLIPLLCKENMGLTVGAFGLYAIFVKRAYRWGVGWFIMGIVTFGLTSFWLIPFVRGEGSDTLDRYAWLGSSATEILLHALSHPGKVMSQLITPDRLFYLTQLLLPVGFLALLGLPEVALAIPGLGLNMLARHHCQPTIYCQYTVPVTPFILIAGVYGLYRLREGFHVSGWRMIGTLLLLLTLFSFWLDNPFSESNALPMAIDAPGNAEVVRMALSTVPEDLSLVTTNDYAPHLARRQGLHIIGIPSQREAPSDPDVVFINLYDQEYIICDQYQDYVSKLAIDDYGVIFRTGGLIVIQRGVGDNLSFRDFVENWNNCAG